MHYRKKNDNFKIRNMQIKNSRLIFFSIYVIIILVIMYFSVDILRNTEQYLSKIKFSADIKLIKYIMGIFLFVSILMFIAFVMQQFKIMSIKKNIGDMEDEIQNLKAKLYDKSQEEEKDSDEDTDGEEEEEEDKDPT